MRVEGAERERERETMSQRKEGLRGYKLKFNRSINTSVCVRVRERERGRRETNVN